VLTDAAHIIRHKATTFNKAVSELSAKSRWCLSGTPIQNKLDDIGALFAFIRVHPFHSLAMFRRFISTPFYESKERRAIAARHLTVLIDSLCLRRTRDVLNLPKPQEKTCAVQFSAPELEQYEQSVKTMNRALRVRPGKSSGVDGFGMFIIQLQLRILCNHGTFQHRLAWRRRAWLEEKEDAVSSSGDLRCSLCRQVMPMSTSSNIYRTYADRCPHVMCTECLQEHDPESLSQAVSSCPICSSRTETGAGGLSDEMYFQPGGQSSKMQRLVADVKANLRKTKRSVI
jgi:hypothetical protein